MVIMKPHVLPVFLIRGMKSRWLRQTHRGAVRGTNAISGSVEHSLSNPPLISSIALGVMR